MMTAEKGQPVAWRAHDGVVYLDVDLRGVATADIVEIARGALYELEFAPVGTAVLVDVTDVAPDRQWLYHARGTNHTVLGPKQLRTAFIGISGVKAAMFRGLLAASSVKPRQFRTREEAIAWFALTEPTPD